MPTVATASANHRMVSGLRSDYRITEVGSMPDDNRGNTTPTEASSDNPVGRCNRLRSSMSTSDLGKGWFACVFFEILVLVLHELRLPYVAVVVNCAA